MSEACFLLAVEEDSSKKKKTGWKNVLCVGLLSFHVDDLDSIWRSSSWSWRGSSLGDDICTVPLLFFQFGIPINLCKAWRQSQAAVSTTGMKRVMLLGWCSLLWGAPPSPVTEKFAPVIYQVFPGCQGDGGSHGRLLLGGPVCNMCILGLWWADKNCWCAHCC